MKKNKTTLYVLIGILLTNSMTAQNSYQYKVDLTKIIGDRLKVELIAPLINSGDIIFHLPKIVPGTYINSDFGKFIHGVKATDKNGKALLVIMLPDSNSWKIKNARILYKLEYEVEDTWDATVKHSVYEMAGTNFEEGKNFVLNTFGLFGYFEGMKKNIFQVEFIKPENFYASTALTPVKTTAVADIFRCEGADLFYDSPVMYDIPDTTTVKVGNANILISVYSPKKLVTSAFIAENIRGLLEAAKNYLGGKLPVSRYAFLYYFNGEQRTVRGQGALEHSYSSVYSFTERPEKSIITNIVDISSHEFFHIVTPLNMCSQEVREFDYNNTVLSRHLWLYEGSTEYDANHTQVTQGLITPEEYLNRLAQKIRTSRKFFNDTLPFTELSLQSAGKYADQFINVYNKGALIAACLDIYLLKLSRGNYGIKNLKHDLSVKYGAENYFRDEALFEEITKLSFPEVNSFFCDYVGGNKAIPYETYFGEVGIRYIPLVDTMVFSIGGFSANASAAGELNIASISKLNDFGKQMGFRQNDILVSLNKKEISLSNFPTLLAEYSSSVKEGDMVSVIVKRKNEQGNEEMITLSAKAFKIKRTEEHLLQFDNIVSPAQMMLRNKWLNIVCKQ